MPKFTTPYDTLLRVRRIEEDRAKADLAAANLGRRRAQGRLDANRAGYARAIAQPHGETELAAFTAHAAHARSAAQAVGLAVGEVEQADEARSQAAQVTRQASMRTQGLERLVERAREARDAEMLAADQRTAEESMTGKRRAASAGPSARRPRPGPDTDGGNTPAEADRSDQAAREGAA